MFSVQHDPRTVFEVTATMQPEDKGQATGCKVQEKGAELDQGMGYSTAKTLCHGFHKDQTTLADQCYGANCRTRVRVQG